MDAVLEKLRLRMEAAAEAMDFEAAARLRDQISVLRGRDDDDATEIDTSGLERHKPGAMGLGSSAQAVEPPPGWVPPKRPDPMTTNRSKPRRR